MHKSWLQKASFTVFAWAPASFEWATGKRLVTSAAPFSTERRDTSVSGTRAKCSSQQLIDNLQRRPRAASAKAMTARLIGDSQQGNFDHSADVQAKNVFTAAKGPPRLITPRDGGRPTTP